jgi:hypothetical protein
MIGRPLRTLLILSFALLFCLGAPVESQTPRQQNFDTLKVYEARYGFSFSQVNPTTIMLQGLVP